MISHIFWKREGFWSITPDNNKNIPDDFATSYTAIAVESNLRSAYSNVDEFAKVCANKIPLTATYDTMVITENPSDNKYLCYVTNMMDSEESESQPASPPPASPPPASPTPPPPTSIKEVTGLILKSNFRFNKDGTNTQYKSAKTEAGGKDVMWEYAGNERWNFYVPDNFENNSKGTLICNSNNQCITARRSKENLDESLKLRPKPETGDQDNSWQFKKYGSNNYTICTNVKLDNDAKETNLCLMPFIYTNKRGKNRLDILKAQFGYEPTSGQLPPSEFLWEIDGIPDNFEAMEIAMTPNLFDKLKNPPRDTRNLGDFKNAQSVAQGWFPGMSGIPKIPGIPGIPGV